MQRLLGDDYSAFAAAMQAPAPVSIRANPFKVSENGSDLFPDAIPVPWCASGWYLPERPVFTLDPRFHAGAYYVQEASSMFLHEALRQTTDFSRPLRVLDLCAAPGGKSTLLASLLSADSLLVANEVVRQRAAVLRENIEKWGCSNTAVTSASADDFAALDDWFDVVVADAPCSGEGLFRKDPEAVREWSLPQVEVCAARQQNILAGAVAALKPGGVLVYSTCTYNQSENENNAAWLATTFALEPLTLTIPDTWGIQSLSLPHNTQFPIPNTCRFFPHRLRGEGFFIALFRKKEAPPSRDKRRSSGFRNIQPLAKNLIPEAQAWLRTEIEMRFFQTPSGDVLALPAHLEADYRMLDHVLKNKWFGTRIGQFKGRDFVPDHALALSNAAAPTLPYAALSREQALLFLKKENFELPSGAPAKGWVLARYQDLNLGWLKVLPNRWNNYLPQERRIRMRTD